MIDEAHSYGVYGYGLAHELNLIDNIDFLIVPLGKGGGSMGAYVMTTQLFKDYIINKSYEFIYSTANPPINNAWNLFLLEKMPTFSKQRKKLQELSKFFLEILRKHQIHTNSKSHIISIIIGDNQKATFVAEQLKQNGFQIYAIKEPTVPKNTARLRISLNSTLKKEDLLHFTQLLSKKLNSKEKKMNLILFFNGWGMDETLVNHLPLPKNYHLKIINYPYKIEKIKRKV